MEQTLKQAIDDILTLEIMSWSVSRGVEKDAIERGVALNTTGYETIEIKVVVFRGYELCETK